MLMYNKRISVQKKREEDRDAYTNDKERREREKKRKD